MQNFLIGRHQWDISVEGGCYNEPVGGIAMQVHQLARLQGYASVERNFHQTRL